MTANCTDTADDAVPTSERVIFLSITVVLVGLSGLFSGLNLGLMSFTDDDLRVVIEGSSDPSEVKNAERIRPLRKRGNLLLCTLLLGNTLVNAMIAILLADIASGIVGGLVTTGLIVVFGEITPQSICSRYALAIGARSVPIVWVFLVICFPIAFPISVILDKILGREMGGIYSRGELLALINMNTADPERAKATGLTTDDGKLLLGALTYSKRLASEIMTPISEVFSISNDAILDKTTVYKMLQHGHTRIPVHKGEPDNIVAILYCRDLVGVGCDRKVPVSAVLETVDAASRLLRIPGSSTARDAFELTQKERRHMLVVTDDPPKDALDKPMPAKGILTLEDIIEEIIQDKIIGESDQFIHPKGPSKQVNAMRTDPHALLKTLESRYGEDSALLPGAVDEK